MADLAKQIELLNTQLASQLPLETLEVFNQSILDLKRQNLEANSIKVNDRFPDFILENALQIPIHSHDILKKGKMVVTFYRGSWCPYCNLELIALQNALSKIKTQNYTLVAISPQSPDHSLTLVEKLNLNFEVLTDTNNSLAKQLGIAFQVQDFVLPYYQQLGIELAIFNNNIENTLPFPALFIIDQDSTLCYKFVDSDYTQRMPTEQLIELLCQL